jgi:hypothetical protein
LEAGNRRERWEGLAGLLLRDALLVGVPAMDLYFIRHAQSKSNIGDDLMGADAEPTEVG